MKKALLLITMVLVLASSLSAAVINNIAELDAAALFSFSAFGDNNGRCAGNYHGEYGDPDNNALGMSRLEPWIESHDEFCLGTGDHGQGSRVAWFETTESVPFWNNHYYPVLGDNGNETSYVYGTTADQATWGRGWVQFQALNNFFTRNTAVDQITFRPVGSNVLSSKSKAEPTVMVEYPDQLCEYYATRTKDAFTFHIIGLNIPDPGVLTPRSKTFMLDTLNVIATTKTDYDVVIVNAQKAKWVQRVGLSKAERDTLFGIADLILCGDDHVYRRQGEYDADYDGTEAIWMNTGMPAYNTGSGRGYLNFHMFDNPPRFTVQYILTEENSTRQLHVNTIQKGSTQQGLPAEQMKPYLKYINGEYVSVDWQNFPIGSAANGAQYISQTVQAELDPGETTSVSITMKNTGTDTWTSAAGHKLGTQNPQGNTTWTGGTRVELPNSVTPDQQVTFTFDITAPSTPGTYNFQWQMVDDVAPNQSWFGSKTLNVPIQVGSTLPVVTFIEPTDLNPTVGSTLYVNVGATDPEGVDRVRLYKDGVELGRSEGLAPYEWNGTGQTDPELQNLQEGTFVLTARATDAVGDVGEESVVITVGSGGGGTDPVVTFASPSSNIILTEGASLQVTVNAADNDGITQVRLYKDGQKLTRDEDDAPYEWGVAGQNDSELENLSVGTFVLTAEATDSLSNIGTTSSGITVTVQAAGGGEPGEVILAVDLHQNAGDSVPTNPDYFTGWFVGNVDAGIAAPSTNINGYTVILGSGTSKDCLTTPALMTGMNARNRSNGYILDAGSFTQADMMRERIAALVANADTDGSGTGLYLKVAGLSANTDYVIQAWGVDSTGAFTNANVALKNGYNYGFDATFEAGGYTSLPQVGTYTVAGSPTTIIDNDTHSVSGTITTDGSGTLIYKQVSNIDKSVMNGFTVSSVVGPTNLPPTWNSDPVVKANAQVDAAYSGTLSGDASDPDSDPLTFTKTGGASWMAVASNGALSGTPTAEGQFSATVTVSDGVNLAVAVSVQVTVDPPPLEGYDLWADSLGIGDGAEDNDGDGRSNLLEYATDGDPQDTNDADPTVVKSGNNFLYTYDKRNDDPNLVFSVEVCTDLTANSWADSGTVPSVNSSAGVYDNVTHTIPADQAQSYIRLKVTNQ